MNKTATEGEDGQKTQIQGKKQKRQNDQYLCLGNEVCLDSILFEKPYSCSISMYYFEQNKVWILEKKKKKKKVLPLFLHNVDLYKTILTRGSTDVLMLHNVQHSYSKCFYSSKKCVHNIASICTI